MDLDKLFVEELNYEYLATPIRFPEGLSSKDIVELEIRYQAHEFKIIVCKLKSLDSHFQKKVIEGLKNDYPNSAYIFINQDESQINLYNYTIVDGSTARLKKLSYDELSNKVRTFKEKIRFFDVTKDVTGRLVLKEKIDKAFESEKVTKKFYQEFTRHHSVLLKFIKNIKLEKDKEWYASVILNRLMFIYFIQKKGFIDKNCNYLSDKYAELITDNKKDFNFYNDFLSLLFFEGFAKRPEERNKKANSLLGKIPYLNGGLFLKHELELKYPDITIDNKIFKEVFDYFDSYIWYLDDRPLKSENEINADVLGYIFEKYINQKEMGAYYTKEDITGYITKNTIIPFIFDKLKQVCNISFSEIKNLKIQDYIYESIKQNEYLSTEIEREYSLRQKQYEELKRLKIEDLNINDFITYNLDVVSFIIDYIKQVKDENILKHLYFDVLKKITVLDPACGSGAFLFAALNILFQLYETSLSVFPKFIDAKKYKYASQFTDEIERISKHPNQNYFILKTIILHNLYGVDIMQEAIEICKLRLFLKMVSQIEDVNDIEPLPDIDFNILTGNTLIGIVRTDEIKQKYVGKLDFNNVVQRIHDLERKITSFRTKQTILEDFGAKKGDFEIYQKSKNDIKQSLNEVNRLINSDLQSDYSVNDYNIFLSNYQPFNWVVEFNDIIENGGFDVIIGNPPYVEGIKLKNTYQVLPYEKSFGSGKNKQLKINQIGYKTFSCGNLYAYMTERSYALLNSNGRFGMIVPLSSICTERMHPLQETILAKSCWISNYAERPSKLFEGPEVMLSIILSSCKEQNNFAFDCYTTTYNKWYTEEREHLFKLLSYTKTEDRFIKRGSIPKIGSLLEKGILEKLFSNTKSLSSYFIKSDSNHLIFYRNAGGRYFKVIIDFKPIFKQGGKLSSSSVEQVIRIETEPSRDVIVALLNSNLFYWFYTIYSDEWHLIGKELALFTFDLQAMNPSLIKNAIDLKRKLMKDVNSNSMLKVNNRKSGKIEYQEFYVSKSKNLIDKIDDVFAKHYHFTDEEMDFLINYDIKYRLGDEIPLEEENEVEADEELIIKAT